MAPGKGKAAKKTSVEQTPVLKTSVDQTPGGTSKGSEGKLKLKRKRRGKRKETFNVYIFKVLKQCHRDIGISRQSMSVMNSFMYDIFERIAAESANLVKYNKKTTMSSRDVQAAVRLVIPGELAKHAIAEGQKAITNYTNSISKD